MWSRRWPPTPWTRWSVSSRRPSRAPEHPDYGLFCESHTAHWPLAWPPLLFVMRRLVLNRTPKPVPGLVLRTRALRAERLRGEPLNETEVEDLVSGLYRMAGLDRDDPAASPMAMFLRTNFLSEEQISDEDANPARRQTGKNGPG